MRERIYYSDEARQQAHRERTMLIAAALTLGTAAGAALSWLFMTKRGEEVRHQAQAALEEGYRQARETTAEALAQLESEIPDLRDRVEEQIRKVEKRIPEWRKQIDGKVAQLSG